MRIFIAGITGFLGGALAPRLIAEGHDVVGLSRSAAPSDSGVDVVRGDLNTGDGLAEALNGVEVAYYLAHSLESGNDEGYAVRDRRMANNFVAAVRAAGVRRVIYLGVFDIDAPGEGSSHQRCRLEVDAILRGATPESLSLRASAVIGASNWYFQALTNMAKRLPVVVLPLGGRLLLQPIDERDAVECLLAAATSEAVAGRAVDIAGEEVISQRQFMTVLLELLGKRPRVMGLPFAVPWLLSRMFAAAAGGDPAILIPLFYTGLTNNVAREAGAALLGVRTRSLRDSMDDALIAGGHVAPSDEPRRAEGRAA